MKYQILIIRLLCAILDLLIFPNKLEAETIKGYQLLRSRSLAYASELENERNQGIV